MTRTVMLYVHEVPDNMSAEDLAKRFDAASLDISSAVWVTSLPDAEKVGGK